MTRVRFNHMELTFPVGELTDDLRGEIDAFWGAGGVFGWRTSEVDIVGQRCHLLQPDDGQFILLAESKRPMSSPGYDHLGLLCSTRDEVDHLLDQCKRFQEKDDRVQIKEYDDLPAGRIVVRAFYVKYLLPIWFDVQCMELADGSSLPNAWADS